MVKERAKKKLLFLIFFTYYSSLLCSIAFKEMSSFVLGRMKNTRENSWRIGKRGGRGHGGEGVN